MTKSIEGCSIYRLIYWMHKCLDFNSMWFYLLNKDVGEFYKETSPHNIFKPAAWLIHIKGIPNFISIAIQKKFFLNITLFHFLLYTALIPWTVFMRKALEWIILNVVLARLDTKRLAGKKFNVNDSSQCYR